MGCEPTVQLDRGKPSIFAGKDRVPTGRQGEPFHYRDGRNPAA